MPRRQSHRPHRATQANFAGVEQRIIAAFENRLRQVEIRILGVVAAMLSLLFDLEIHPVMSGDKRVCVGVITGAHGVRGAVRLKSFTAEPEDVAGYGPLEDERGERRFALRIVGSAKGVLIAAISGIDDRDRAEALRGLRLYLPRSALPPTDEEEYYHADLIGLDAALADGTPIGTVRAVHDFGAGDTLEIERAERAAGDGAVYPGGRAGGRSRRRPAGYRSAAGSARPQGPSRTG